MNPDVEHINFKFIYPKGAGRNDFSISYNLKIGSNLTNSKKSANFYLPESILSYSFTINGVTFLPCPVMGIENVLLENGTFGYLIKQNNVVIDEILPLKYSEAVEIRLSDKSTV